MNKDFFLEILNSFEFIENGQRTYSTFLESVKKEGINIAPETLMALETISYKRTENFLRLKDGIRSLQKVLQPDKYEQLMTAIERERSLAVMLNNSCKNFISVKDQRYLSAIYNIVEAEKKYVGELGQAFSMVEDQFGILFVSSALNNQMSLKDIQELANSLRPGSDIQKNMEQLVQTLQRKSQKEAQSKDLPMVRSTIKVQAAEEKEPSLQEKIDQINYSLDGNLVAEVEGLTVEDRIHQIDNSMAELNKNPNRTFKDMVALQTLLQERLELEAYLSRLEDKKLSRSQIKRDKKMKVATMKLEENNNKLAKSKENYESYHSKIARFFSARYQGKLNEKISKLQQKRGTLQEEQKLSAIAKFDKKSKKMVRKSRVFGFGKAAVEYKNDKIAQLKAFRDQVVEEFKSIRNDYSRFRSSKKDNMESLKNKNGVIPSPMITVEEHSKKNSSGKVA